MKRLIQILSMLVVLAYANCSVADIFDKAEAAKECATTGNCKSKWGQRLIALQQCQKVGNCTEKALGAANENQDKIVGAADKANAVSRCLHTNDPVEQKKCYEIVKTRYREKAAKKEEAKQEMHAHAYEKKSIGDAICLPGKLAFGLVKVKVKGFVEQVNGDKIQVRIVDTEGQEVTYNSQSLHQNSILWDQQSNWIQCTYLAKK